MTVQAVLLVQKYQRLLKDPHWPESNTAARRAVMALSRRLEAEVERARLREEMLRR